MENVTISRFDGTDFQVMTQFEGWKIGLLRHSQRFSACCQMERHLETDEVFVLLQGEAGLLIGKERLQVPLEIGKICNVKRGIWHRVYMTPGAKVLIAENTDTGPHNTEYHRL